MHPKAGHAGIVKDKLTAFAVGLVGGVVNLLARRSATVTAAA